MSLNSTTITNDVKAAVKAEFLTQFPNSSPPSTGDAIATAMAAVVAAVIPVLVTHIKDNALVTVENATAGSDTVWGVVD